ncbi:MAG: hypothetical protein ACLFVU_10615, partial [Phycisphaerae bacterium]
RSRQRSAGSTILVTRSEGCNRLGKRYYKKYDFFDEGAQPFVSGNRIFIRSYSNVYCSAIRKCR